MIYTNEELKEFFKNLEANDKTKASYALRKLHPYSITKVLETLSEPFDREAVAERTAAKYKDTEGHKYSGKEAWEIIQMWEEKSEISRTTGKLLDDYIGAVLTNSIKSVEIYNSEIAKLSTPPQYIAYRYFYDMNIAGQPIFETLRNMYINRKSFPEFMEQARDWINKNETELRDKISQAEK